MGSGRRGSDGEKNKNDVGPEMVSGGKFLGGMQRGRPTHRHRNETGKYKIKKVIGLGSRSLVPSTVWF